MPWFNVDDGFAFHRKAVKAGNAAIGLWTRAGSWSNQQLTDGLIPDEMVTVLGTDAQARRLVTAGLWTRIDGGYQFHEWNAEGRNKTRQQVEEHRQREAEKKANARAAKAARAAADEADPENSGKKYGRTVGRPQKNSYIDPSEQNDPFSEEPQVNDGCPQGTEQGVPRGVPEGHASTTPLPSQKNNQQTSSVGTPKRATRIPDDFAPTPEMIEWAREHTPNIGWPETEDFIDYWQAKSGKDATKVDWPATWRRWMRKAQTDTHRSSRPAAAGRGAKVEGWLALGAQTTTTQGITEPRPFGVIEGGRTA